MLRLISLTAILVGGYFMADAQQTAKHEDTEFYEPVPPVVTPGKTNNDPPSDAIILFSGSTLR